MKKWPIKKVSIICCLILIAAFGGFGLYEWMTKGIISILALFFVFLGIGILKRLIAPFF